MNIENLPFEMIEKILSHLDKHDNTTFDQNLHLVCQKFFKACRSLEFTKLLLGSPSTIRTSNHPLAREIKIGHYAITKLNIDSNMDIEEIIKFFIKNKQIKSIKINTSVTSNFEMHYFLHKLKHLPLLKKMDVQFNGLNDTGTSLEDRVIKTIINSCPNLQNISLRIPHKLFISERAIKAFSKLKNLQTLKLKNLALPNTFTGIFINEFPMLKHMSMPDQVYPINVNSFLNNAPNLESYDIPSSVFDLTQLNEDTIHKLRKLGTCVSFINIVDEGLFYLEKMKFGYGERLEEFCSKFEDFPNLKSIVLVPNEEYELEEIADFVFKNDVTLTLKNFTVLESNWKSILSNKKVKNLVIDNSSLWLTNPHIVKNDISLRNHSLQTISLKGDSRYLIDNFEFFQKHFYLKHLIKTIHLRESEIELEVINFLAECPDLKELKICGLQKSLKGKNEIYSYLAPFLVNENKSLEDVYTGLLEQMMLHNHPLKEVLNFISDHQLEETIEELDLFVEITGQEHRLLHLPQLNKLSFVENHEFFELENKERIQEFLTNRLPIVGQMLGKRSISQDKGNSKRPRLS